MTEILESLQRKLQVATSPTVARHTVAGIFATLRKAAISADSRTSAISFCLSRPHKVIVQEAADQLLSLTSSGGLPPADAVEFLLSAVTTAGAAVAAPLADAVCRLLVLFNGLAEPRVSGLAATPQPLPLRPGRWTSHPLVSALLACPAASAQLLTSSLGALTTAAAAAARAAAASTAAKDTRGSSVAVVGPAAPSAVDAAAAAAAAAAVAGALTRTWAALEPFFSFVMLQRHAFTVASERPAAASAGPISATAAGSASSVPASALATCALTAWLHGQLVRLACSDLAQPPGPAPGASLEGPNAETGASSSFPSFRLRLLEFLVAHLLLGPRAAEVDRMHAVESTTDLLDVLDAVLFDIPECGDANMSAAATAAAERLADALLQLAFEIIGGGTAGGGGGGGGGAQVVAALLRLQSLVPEALAGHVAALSLLSLSAYGKELQGLHLLLHKTLQHQGRPPAVGAATAALSLQPLLAAVAFGTSAPATAAAAWPTHLAATLQRFMTPDAAEAGGGGGGGGAAGDGSLSYGDLCLHQQCRRLLLSLWTATGQPTSGSQSGTGGSGVGSVSYDVFRWLRSLELALRQRRRAAAAAKAASEQLPFATRLADVVSEAALGARDAHPAVTCLVAALLAHPDPRVRVAAAAAARELVLLLPAAALPLLPLIMYQLQRGGAAAGAAGAAGSAAAGEGARAQLALLQLLPVMAADPSVAPYALRVLQPMLAPEGPELLSCLALKLLCDTWLLSGRGWPQVEAALNGLTPPGARDPPPCLRVTRAALLRAVCDRDPGRGVELVSALQQCICDTTCPAAVALGLEALGVLVEEDVLDFYAAYKVVHRWLPGLPPDPLVAGRWVALLAHGSLDAEAYPDKVAAVLDILWSAARHPEGQVRAAAFIAISRYPPEMLEKLEVLRPLSQYTAPLMTESDPRVGRAARVLAAVALRFEHANRRRLLLTQPAADARQPASDPTDTSAAPADGADSAAAGSGGAGSGTAPGSRGAAYAAAATAREARALRGRLLGRIPKTLLAGSGPATAAGRGPGGARSSTAGISAKTFHPGAVLFCYSRPPPPPLPPGATAAAAAAAAKRAAAEARDAYGQRLRDGLRRLGWRGQWHARLAVQAWAAFLRRWMYETGLPAPEAAGMLVAEWDGRTAGAAAAAGASAAGNGVDGATAQTGAAAAAPAAVLEGVGLTAGALCIAAEGLREAEVSSLVARLLQQAQSGRSSGITRSSLLGAALAATRLHPTDWAARQQVLSELRAQLLTAPTAVVRSAAATALAVLAGSLAADPAVYIPTGGSTAGSGAHSRELVAVSEALTCLTGCLGALCPQLAPPLAELAASGLPADWPRPEDQSSSYTAAPKPLKDDVDEQEVLPGTAVALVSLLCDINRAHGLPPGALGGLLSALVAVAAAARAADGEGEDGHAGGAARGRGRGRGCSTAAAAAAALEAAAVLAPEALRHQQLEAEELSYMFAVLRALCSSNGVQDGRVRGAAAYCLGCVAAAAVRQGMFTRELVSELGLAPQPPSSASPAKAAASLAAAAAGSKSDDSAALAATALSGLVSELAEQAATGSSRGGAAAPGRSDAALSSSSAVEGVTPAAGAGTPAASAVGKGQHVAAARTGAVAGLAALLLPPPPSLVDALSPITPGAIGAGLLAQPENITPAKAAVRELEALATEDADPWVTSTAAFHLAAVAAATAAAEGVDEAAAGPAGGAGGDVAGVAEGEGSGALGGGGGRHSGAAGGAAGGGAGPKALSLYPPEGAVRPLVAILMDRSRLGGVPRNALADTLLALAAAPALPAADWPTACRTLLAAGSSSSSLSSPRGSTVLSPRSVTVSIPDSGSGSGLRLQAATLLLALAHASVASLGLGAVLEELVAPARFAALPPPLQALLLARLPALLRSLATKRGAAVLQALPSLLATAVATAAAAGGTAAVSDNANDAIIPLGHAAGLDEPGAMGVWLRRIRQSVGLLGGTLADATGSGRGSGCSGSGGGGEGGWLVAHCWLGLLGVCRAWQAKDPVLAHRDITQATHSAIAALACQLPDLPPLQPGEAAQLLSWASTQLASRGASGAASAAAGLTSGGAGGPADEWDSYGPAGRPLASPETAEEAQLGGEAGFPWPAAVSGTGAPLTSGADDGRSSGGDGTSEEAYGSPRAAVTLWGLAACVLRCLRPDFLSAQVLAAEALTPGAPAAAALMPALALDARVAPLQLRCVLVASGHVSYRELMPVRTAACSGVMLVPMRAPVPSAGAPGAASAVSLTKGEGDPLLSLLALALAGTPQAFQVQVLLQTLDGARVALQQQGQQLSSQETQHGQQPGRSLELAAALVAACLSHAAGAAESTAPELCIALTSRRAALECLPYTLPRLLSKPPWSSSCEAVAQALLAVQREALARGRAGGGASTEPSGVVLSCLWALRDMLPSYTYDQMHSVLNWKVLAQVAGGTCGA